MPKGVYDRKKARGKRGAKKQYAQPLKLVKRGRPKKVEVKKAARKVTARRGRPPGSGKPKAEALIAALHADVLKLIDIQRAAFIDNFRYYHIKNNGSIQDFLNIYPTSFEALAISKQDLDKVVKEYVGEEEEAPEEAGQASEPGTRLTVEELNVL